MLYVPNFYETSFQSLSCVRLFVTSWIAACQASLSITNYRSLPKLMSIESVMPSNHLIAFWIPAKPLHLRNMLSKSMRCTENSNTCSQHWSTERVQQRSTTRLTTNTSKVKWTELWCFASPAIFTWPLTNWLPLQVSQQPFAGKMLPQLAGGRKCFSRVHRIPRHRVSCYGNIQTYFSWQKYVDCNGSYFDW